MNRAAFWKSIFLRCCFVAATGLLAIGFVNDISAGPLLDRRITVGTSSPGASTTHTLQFSILDATVIGSIRFEYCTNNPFHNDTCDAPAGLSALSSSLTDQQGEAGFAIHANTTANDIIISRTAALTTPGVLVYEFSDIVNPTTFKQSVYVRISTYASDDASGSITDKDAVVFSTSGNVSVETYVPPFIVLCVGVTVSGDCSSYSGSLQNLGELASNKTAVTNSQLAVATNDGNGYTVGIVGTTLTSGNNTIAPLSSPTASAQGQSQFGINLRDNNIPDVGLDPSGVGTGAPTASYGLQDLFVFQPGAIIASSALASDYNVFTVSYMVNVSSSQSPGSYATTMTYIATAQF